jgi:hypothetical protein
MNSRAAEEMIAMLFYKIQHIRNNVCCCAKLHNHFKNMISRTYVALVEKGRYMFNM